eukprot:14604577-Alexandrium_andersonii.AAC.1
MLHKHPFKSWASSSEKRCHLLRWAPPDPRLRAWGGYSGKSSSTHHPHEQLHADRSQHQPPTIDDNSMWDLWGELFQPIPRNRMPPT